MSHRRGPPGPADARENLLPVRQVKEEGFRATQHSGPCPKLDSVASAGASRFALLPRPAQPATASDPLRRGIRTAASLRLRRASWRRLRRGRGPLRLGTSCPVVGGAPAIAPASPLPRGLNSGRAIVLPAGHDARRRLSKPGHRRGGDELGLHPSLDTPPPSSSGSSSSPLVAWVGGGHSGGGGGGGGGRGGGNNDQISQARLQPSLSLDFLGNDLINLCASFLNADGLAQLGRTSARFGIPQAGQQRSLVNEAAHQRFRQSATDEERSRLPKYDDESDIGLYRALRQLRQPLCFDQLAGRGFRPQEHPSRVTYSGSGWSTAVSGHVMRGGRHFVEFSIAEHEGIPYISLGVIRPVSLTDGIDVRAHWIGNVDPAIVWSSNKAVVAEKLRSQRTAQWGESRVTAVPTTVVMDYVTRRTGTQDGAIPSGKG
ncbi:hypothetical protein THAOC_31816, partial [Thalassiosira oceanica]